jgi:YidC/Oxa1 family membrane protein insertase
MHVKHGSKILSAIAGFPSIGRVSAMSMPSSLRMRIPTITNKNNNKVRYFSAGAAPPVLSVDSGEVDSSVSAALDSVRVVADAVPELGWKASHIAMYYIDQIHVISGLPYWGSIIAATIGLRIMLLPIAISSQKNAGRLTQLRPHMDKLQERMKLDPRLEANDQKAQLQYKQEAQALFKKYKVNPAMAFMMPLAQMPIFFSFYFGMTEMGTYFPAMSLGGAYWFTDLCLPDETYYLPLMNSALFMLMGEVGSNEMKEEHKRIFKWTMRGVSIAFLPLMAHLPSGLFLYFLTQSGLSVFQAQAFKTPLIRDALGMPKLPAAIVQTAGTTSKPAPNPFAKISELMEKERAQSEHVKAEVIDGTIPPPPPSFPSGADTSKPVTFTQKPKVKK